MGRKAEKFWGKMIKRQLKVAVDGRTCLRDDLLHG